MRALAAAQPRACIKGNIDNYMKLINMHIAFDISIAGPNAHAHTCVFMWRVLPKYINFSNRTEHSQSHLFGMYNCIALLLYIYIVKFAGLCLEIFFF